MVDPVLYVLVDWNEIGMFNTKSYVMGMLEITIESSFISLTCKHALHNCIDEIRIQVRYSS